MALFPPAFRVMGGAVPIYFEAAAVSTVLVLLGQVIELRLNLWFAFIYNAAGIPIAAGMLYPFFGILLSPVVAAAAMALSPVSVIVKSLPLRSSPLPE